MALQPTRNNSDDFEALAPIDPLPVNGHQPLHTYFGEPHNALPAACSRSAGAWM
jgi:hypothetical protein